MPTFVAYCIDKPNALDLRMANRPDHLEFIKAKGAMVRLAGPFLSDAGEMTGSMIVLDAPDLAAAEAFCAEDPYARAGLFQRVDIRVWRVSIGELP